MDNKCYGVIVKGIWRGYPCCNLSPLYIAQRDGKTYCASHIMIAENEPERFENAKQSLDKKLKKIADKIDNEQAK